MKKRAPHHQCLKGSPYDDTFTQPARQIDPVLTNLALGYKQAEFIGEKLMPVVFTDKEGVKVPKFGKGSFVEHATERAVGAASNVITLDTPHYLPIVLEEHDLMAGVDYREAAESLFDERAKSHAPRGAGRAAAPRAGNRCAVASPSSLTRAGITKTCPPPPNGAMPTPTP